MSDLAGEHQSYDDAIAHLDEFGQALTGLISELLAAGGIRVHSVTYRVKDKESAKRKMIGDSERFAEYSDLHDLLGLRIVTYFAEEVDSAAQVLVPEFAVDEDASVDKRAILDADRFGYLSLHYVAGLSPGHLAQEQYRAFDGLRFELQIRSMLQHAWAEIEHDLGYKADDAPPRDARRRFSRLAGLLELADDEFQRLRHDLADYEQTLREQITIPQAAIEVDQSSVLALIESGALDQLNERIARLFSAQIIPTINRSECAQLARGLHEMGVTDIRTVRQLITEWEDHIVAFAQVWLRANPWGNRRRRLHRNIGLFYLTCAVAGAVDPADAERWEAIRIHAGRRGPGGPGGFVARARVLWLEVVNALGPPPAVPFG